LIPQKVSRLPRTKFSAKRWLWFLIDDARSLDDRNLQKHLYMQRFWCRKLAKNILSLCVASFRPRDGVPAPHRVRKSNGRWLGRMWVAGLSSCAKALTTLEIRALDITTFLISYPQAIDASWPLFRVWALPYSTCLSERSDTPKRCEIIITSHYLVRRLNLFRVLSAT
jgi:hypothetical protein